MAIRTDDSREHEVAFCAEVSKWADRLFDSDPSLPFHSSKVEQFGRGTQKRSDLRVFSREDHGKGSLVLCGEVKLPGTAQGTSPFNLSLMKDAYEKAVNSGCRYFFTWNVEHLALFDRALWDAPTLHERCIGEWELDEQLNKPSDVTLPSVIAKVRDEFLPRFFREFGSILRGERRSFAKAPDEFYISVLETHLAGPLGPVRITRDYLDSESDRDKAFDLRLRHWMTAEQQWSFDRRAPDSWRKTIDRAARSIVYVLNNRILFYEAVRTRHRLRELRFPRTAKTPEHALKYLRRQFQEAVRVTGDYEPVLTPEQQEWATLVALSGDGALLAWQRVIDGIERFNFHQIPTDILGHTFQKLVSPEERHKFGQHYTDETIVDVINAFCIRSGESNVLDPACGSGSFLVRAFYRKAYLDKSLATHEVIAGLYGCDINPFPAHLATLNLAARDMEEGNYPRVVRRNFFTVEPDKVFCTIPKETRDQYGNREKWKIVLPPLDAVVGNPPYLRQEHIPRRADKGVIKDQTKEFIHSRAEGSWPGINLSNQGDLHVYFWPVATRLLTEKGWFGFLTSSSWLDVRYGFPLQRWILMNFRLFAVIESIEEPWFEDARVRTAVTILQRCDDEQKRRRNLVRFVRLLRPLAEILGDGRDEEQKQRGAEALRDLILRTKSGYSNPNLRIVVRRQADLWREGVSVADMFARQKILTQGQLQESAGEDEEVEGGNGAEDQPMLTDYGGGKWGRYLRAPDFYFEVMREFAGRFVRLGEIAMIRRGITSGCDAFFMPRVVSARLLAECLDERSWRSLPLMTGAKRKDVESGDVVAVESDGVLHCIEAEYLRPEVHSLMQVDRPVVTPDQTDRVVLWVDQPLDRLKGTLVYEYIKWGSKHNFVSKKSRPIPIPERPTCKGRKLWYEVTGLEPGIGFWPKAQKYRHIIPWNPHRLAGNCNLYDIHGIGLAEHEQNALMAILNSTLVALFKHFYGRYAGAEGTLKTEVVDVHMLEVPSPVGLPEPLCSRLTAALEEISAREVTHLVEQRFLDCHTEERMRLLQKDPLGLPNELERRDRRTLDVLVFEALGVRSAKRREELVDRLYGETALYHRGQRVQDIQSTINRGRTTSGTPSALDLALNAWSDLDPRWQKPLSGWLEEQTGKAKVVDIAEGPVRLPAENNMFEATTAFIGPKPALAHICSSRAEAELLYTIASTGLRGPVCLPATEAECRSLQQRLGARLLEATKEFETLSESLAGSDKLREQIVAVLNRWFIQGKPGDSSSTFR